MEEKKKKSRTVKKFHLVSDNLMSALAHQGWPLRRRQAGRELGHVTAVYRVQKRFLSFQGKRGGKTIQTRSFVKVILCMNIAHGSSILAPPLTHYMLEDLWEIILQDKLPKLYGAQTGRG
ncbi:uncharacterized protein LOC143928299 [Lithobates pipiens]